MQKIMFDEAYEGIINAYYSKLNAAKDEPGGLIEGTKTIVRGDKVRGTPKPPTIWIFPHASLNNQSMSSMEDWTLPVQLIAVVKNNDPEKGYYEAFRLAARARSVILKDRNFGLPYVRDTISYGFDETEEPNKRKNFYAHYALLWTRFEVYE